MRTDRAVRIADLLATSRDGLTRLELGLRTGDSTATIQRALSDLGDWLAPTAQGAPLRLGRRAGILAAVDVGRRHMRATITDVHGSPLCDPVEHPEPTTVAEHGSAVLEHVVELLTKALASASETQGAAPPYRLGEVRCLAVGVPTPVSADGTGEVSFLVQWSGLPTRAILRELLQAKAEDREDELHPKLEIAVAKDADLGAIAAWRDFVAEDRDEEHAAGQSNGASADRDASCQDIVIFVKASHGIDAGLVCDGRPLTGMNGMAGQLGHMSVPDAAGDLLLDIPSDLIRTFLPPGRRCTRCQREACLERLASGETLCMLLDSLPEVTDAPPTLQALVDEVNNEQTGKPLSVQAVAASGIRVGATLAEAARLVAPRRIVIGGLLAETGETFMRNVTRGFDWVKMNSIGTEVHGVDPARVKSIELEGAVEYARQHLRFTRNEAGTSRSLERSA
jgi:predicted NBD/HSP70 family sugar kinase